VTNFVYINILLRFVILLVFIYIFNLILGAFVPHELAVEDCISLLSLSVCLAKKEDKMFRYNSEFF